MIPGKERNTAYYWPDCGWGFGGSESKNARMERMLRKEHPELDKRWNKYMHTKSGSKEERKALREYEFLLKLLWDYESNVQPGP